MFYSYLGFAALFSFVGLVWLHRAYSGRLAGGLTTLTTTDRQMTRRERLYNLSLGIANLLIGLLYLWIALSKSH